MEMRVKLPPQMFVTRKPGVEVAEKHFNAKIENRERGWMKPERGSGLWTSTYDPQCGSDWIQWARMERYMGEDDEGHWQVLDEDEPGYIPREQRKLYYNCYVLHPTVARIYVVDGLEDLVVLMRDYHHPYRSPWDGGYRYLDFERLAEDFDALHLTERGQWKTRMSSPDLYGWDVESTFWFRWKFSQVEYLGRLGFTYCDSPLQAELAKRELLGLPRCMYCMTDPCECEDE